MQLLLGVMSGFVLPVQTGINGQFRKRIGSPYYASFVSFVIALLFLLILLPFTGGNYMIPFAEIAKEPVWIWFGGICGVIFLTGNILLISKLDGVQTVVLPVMGQILMGLIIDTFGFFQAEKVSMTISRVIGVALVVIGVITVSIAKSNNGTDVKNKEEISSGVSVWLWRVFGVLAGMITAAQAAFNGRLGKVVNSPIKASIVSYMVGIIFLLLVCIVVRVKNGSQLPKNKSDRKTSVWMWSGGVLGGIYILANVSLAGAIGVGTTVIVLLMGSTLGGLLIDHFGILGCEKKSVNRNKIIGIIIMIVGVALIKLV